MINCLFLIMKENYYIKVKKKNGNQIIYSYSLTFIYTSNNTCYYIIE